MNGAKRLLFSVKLYNTLLKHGLCHLHEASDIRTFHIVDSAIGLATELHTLLVDRLHDMVEACIYLLCGPREVFAVLCHLEARSSYTTSVHCLTRSKEYAVVLEVVDSAWLATHVTYLAAAPAAVGLEFLSIVLAELVLERTWESDIARYRPCFLASGEVSLCRELICHILHLVAVA